MKQLLPLIPLLINVIASSQSLTVGDTMPQQQYLNVINHSNENLSFADFKGKYVILDFWATNCVGCITAFPKMEELQKTYNDKLQIILVNRQSKDSTYRFFAKRKQIKMPGLPMITDDTILQRIFPSSGVPHHVWIDPYGRIAATGEKPDKEKLRRWLNNDKKLSLNETDTKLVTLKMTDNTPYITSLDSVAWANIHYWSVLMPALKEKLSENKITKHNGSKKYNRIIGNRVAGIILFHAAWSERLVNTKRIDKVILEVSDTTRFYQPQYAYDLLIPESQANQLFEYMKADMCRYFQATAKLEKRKTPCYVLVRTGKEDLLKTKAGTPFISGKRYTEDSVFIISNKPFIHLENALSRRLYRGFNSIPFVNATAYSGNIDIQVRADVFDSLLKLDFNLLRKELQRYGLDIQLKDWEIDALIITDRE